MKAFADLYQALDETNKTSSKIEAMRDYFAGCDPADGAWAVYFLCGRRINRLVPVAMLRTWCAAISGVSDWMFEECYGAVGDLAETMALLLPEQEGTSHRSLGEWVETRIRPLASMSENERRAVMEEAWSELSSRERFVFNKLVTGGFRVGVSQGLVIRALAEASQLPAAVIAHRLMGNWEPNADFFRRLLDPSEGETDYSQPYPFALAHALPESPTVLGRPDEWLMEWKWDGIRGQMIRRAGESYLWSRGEELILERFPDLQDAIGSLPNGTVLDGEVLAWKEGKVLPFSELQRRIGRKSLGKKILAEVPAKFVAFDVLESAGIDVRLLTLAERRQELEQLLGTRSPDDAILLSPILQADHWDELSQIRDTSRESHVEGVMLKRLDAPYPVGRVTGVWWKWKVTPYTCDAVLIYAQRGNGRRASLYTDYTFGAWQNGQLVPFAKAYSGLSDAEIRDVDRFVRQNTLEQFGPVRSVKPELVFELAFENIQFSKRHKSGIAVRFPRMARWRHDKRPEDADTLDSIKAQMSAARSSDRSSGNDPEGEMTSH